MTTVVYRAGLICADTALFHGYRYTGTCAKIVRGPAGQVAGVSGDAGWAHEFLTWVYEGEQGDWPRPPRESDGSTGSAMLVRYGERPGELFESSGRFLADFEFNAIGCGAAVAIGALATGADAMAALKIAAQFDAYTRAPLVSLTLGGPATWPDWRNDG